MHGAVAVLHAPGRVEVDGRTARPTSSTRAWIASRMTDKHRTQRVSPCTGVDIGAAMNRNNENGFETLDALFILLVIFLLLGVTLVILL